MASQGGPDRHARGFGISDFAHEDDIRVLPQHGPESGRKFQADILPNAYLDDTRQIDLDRVFNSDDLASAIIQAFEKLVDCGGLA